MTRGGQGIPARTTLPGRLASLAPRIALGVAASLLSLACVEGALWLLAPTTRDKGPVARPFTQDLRGLKSEIVYTRNAFGLRSLSMVTRPKGDGTLRILCIGASTTNQPTQNTEDTWCGLLQTLLAGELDDAGVRVETAAYGRGGLKATGLYRWAAAELLSFEPDLVITLMGINDLAFNGGPDYAYDGALDLEEPRTVFMRCRDFSQLCRRGSQAVQRVKNLWKLRFGRVREWHSKALPQRRLEYQGYPPRAELVRSPDPIREFGDAMDALLTLLDEAGVPALVLGQPVLWKADMEPEAEAVLWFFVKTKDGPVRPSGAWLHAEMTRYNARQRELAARHGDRFIDLDARIPKDLDHYFDDCHYTDAGSRRVAREILPELREQLRGVLVTGSDPAAGPARGSRGAVTSRREW